MKYRLVPGAVLALTLAASTAAAQCPTYPVPRAPDAYGPYFYAFNEHCAPYGPNYWLRPCFEPFQGMLLGPSTPSCPGYKVSGGKEAYQGAPKMFAGNPNAPGKPGAPGTVPGYPYGPGKPGAPGAVPGYPYGPGTPGSPGSPGSPGGPPPVPGFPPVPPGPPRPQYMGIPGQPQQGPPQFVNHPFARSPRDFFMLD